VLGTPLAWWLARTRSVLKLPLEALVALPLVLPPTVLGFYLLLALAPDGLLGGPWRALGGGALAFTFTGLVIGSLIYSLPFVVQPLQTAFEGLEERTLEVLPQARQGLLSAATLGFAHTVGEFGVVLMIGGNIPGHTQVLSIAIYDHVEALDYGSAHLLSASLLGLAFVMLLSVYITNRRFRVRMR
jgi:molybdate transport system permease protein